MNFNKIIATTLTITASTICIPSYAFFDLLLQSAAQSALQPGAAASPTKAGAAAPAQLTPEQQAMITKACASDKNADKNPACAPPVKMNFSRPVEQLDKLFTGEPLSGDALMVEMRSLKSSIASNSLNTAMSSMLGANPTNLSPTSQSSMMSGAGFFSSIASSVTDVLLDTLVSELSYQALDVFFSKMTDQPGLLKEVQVTLPKANATMTPEMKQQLVTMASFLVAIKASGKIIDASDKDFDASAESYRKVLDSRVKASTLLGDAFYARSGLFATEQESKARGQKFLSDADMAYLESFREAKPEDFIRDFNAQNIALEYLSKSKPTEYADYRVGLDEFKNHYGAYSRTAVGATSMLAFSSLFLKKAKNMVEKNGLIAAPGLLPMVGEGLKEVTSLVPRVKKTLERSPDTQDGSFTMKLSTGEIKRELTASKVFAALSEENRNAFQEELFKNGQTGYFGKLGEAYPLVAGRILDSLVEKNNRKIFVKGYLQEDDLPDFSFQNALSDNARKTRELKTSLFRSAPNDAATADDEKAIALVQKDVKIKLNKWDNSTLRRIMFANRDIKKRDIEMALNGGLIGIDSPGMKGIMEYEEMTSIGSEHAVVRKTGAEAVPPKKVKPVRKEKK